MYPAAPLLLEEETVGSLLFWLDVLAPFTGGKDVAPLLSWREIVTPFLSWREVVTPAWKVVPPFVRRESLALVEFCQEIVLVDALLSEEEEGRMVEVAEVECEDEEGIFAEECEETEEENEGGTTDS